MNYDKFGNINSVTIMGRAGKDPEVRYSQGGTAILTVSVATSKRIKRKDSAEAEEKTEWHRIVAFGKTAEMASERIVKGTRVLCIGSLQYRSWDKDDGTKAYITEIVADRLESLDKSEGAGGGESAGTSRFRQPPVPSDDDIPF